MERQIALMSSSAEILWWLSHEYGQRLAKTSSYIELLAQIIVERIGADDGAPVLGGLQEAQNYLDSVREEFRGWRYAFLYETPDSKRMVQTDRAVQRALGSFQRMRSRHLEFLNALSAFFAAMPAPDPRLTTVPTGDMWALLIEALSGLIDFDQDRNGISEH